MQSAERRGHPAVVRMEERQPGSHRRTHSVGLFRIAQAGAGYLRDERAAPRCSQRFWSTKRICGWYRRACRIGEPVALLRVAAHLMRQILVDHARKTTAKSAAVGAAKVALEDALGFAPERSSSMIALDDALNQLAKIDARQPRLSNCAFSADSARRRRPGLGVSVAPSGAWARTTAGGGWLHREIGAKRRMTARLAQGGDLFHQAVEIAPETAPLGTPDVQGDSELLRRARLAPRKRSESGEGFVPGPRQERCRRFP